MKSKEKINVQTFVFDGKQGLREHGRKLLSIITESTLIAPTKQNQIRNVLKALKQKRLFVLQQFFIRLQIIKASDRYTFISCPTRFHWDFRDCADIWGKPKRWTKSRSARSWSTMRVSGNSSLMPRYNTSSNCSNKWHTQQSRGHLAHHTGMALDRRAALQCTSKIRRHALSRS